MLDVFVEAAIDRYIATLKGQLIKGALGAYAEGQVQAAHDLNTGLDMPTVREGALKTAQEYSRLLTEEGGTFIDGEFKPWMQKYSQAIREQFTSAIKENLETGQDKIALGNKIKDMLGATREHANQIAAHEIRAIQSQSALERYRERGVEYVDVVGWDIQDGRLCEYCIELMRGGPYPINNAPYLPAHLGCRHRLSPVYPEMS